MIAEKQLSPAISIITPVYRAEDYLEACVESIRAQSISDSELLLVDDGSPDRCPALCDALAAKDKRIRVIHQKNQGPSAARNNALQISSGEWVCFVDSDDALHPQMLEYLYAEACKNDAGIIGCERFESETFPDPAPLTQPSFTRLTIDEQVLERLYREDSAAYWCVWGKLIRKEIVQKNLMTPGRFYEDNAVMCQWLCAAGSVILSEEKLYFYRANPTGTTKSAFNLKKTDYLWALQEQLRFYETLGYETMAEIIASRYLQDAGWIHSQVKTLPDGADKALEIKGEMRDVYRRYRRRLHMSDGQKRNLEAFFSPGKRLLIAILRRGKVILHGHAQKGHSL